MHRAKVFFYVCAGVFLLAVSYHLGARSAGAQAGPADVARLGEGQFFAVVNRIIYGAYQNNIPGPLHDHYSISPVPGTAPVMDVGRGAFNTWMALLADGDVYQSDSAGGNWTRIGNVFGGPVPAQRETFGQLKARYRPQGAAQPGTQDR